MTETTLTYEQLTDDDEREIWRLNYVGRDPQSLASHAVLLHRISRRRDRGTVEYTVGSDIELARRPCPTNGRQLWEQCQTEAARRITRENTPPRCLVPAARLAWAVIALARAVSCKHADRITGSRNFNAGNKRHHYVRLRASAEAFGATLSVVWPEFEESGLGKAA